MPERKRIKKRKTKRLTSIEKKNQYTQALLKASNVEINGYTLSKMGLELGLFFLHRVAAINRKKRKIFKFDKNLFYKKQTDLAEKLQKFSGRPTCPSPASISEALDSLNRMQLIKYEREDPINKQKHGYKKGIKIHLNSPELFEAALR